MSQSKTIMRKRSELRADNAWKLSKLEKAKFYFVPCQIENRGEEICFQYDIEGLQSLQEHSERKDRIWKYAILCQLLELFEEENGYSFSCHPQNIYYDEMGRIKILERDISEADEPDRRLEQVLALAGYLLQKKYQYEDFLEGGYSLLKEQRSTRFLMDITSLCEAQQTIKNRKKEEQKRQEKEYVWCRKRGKTIRDILLVISILAVVTFSGVGGYAYQKVVLPQRAALSAERANLEQDPIKVLEAMEQVPTEEMDSHEKFLVATAYINGQVMDSFDNETKDLLLSRMAYNSEEAVLDYWIDLGRGNADEAIDIAMRKSDDQLLLYAYLQKLDRVAEDETLTGEEKEQQLSDLKSRVKSLADSLGIQYGENKTGGE